MLGWFYCDLNGIFIFLKKWVIPANREVPQHVWGSHIKIYFKTPSAFFVCSANLYNYDFTAISFLNSIAIWLIFVYLTVNFFPDNLSRKEKNPLFVYIILLPSAKFERENMNSFQVIVYERLDHMRKLHFEKNAKNHMMLVSRPSQDVRLSTVNVTHIKR